MWELLGLFLIFSGFIIGLGATTVIDLHGFLARKSSYWTKATIRTHKVTKPMIWVGATLLAIGGVLFYMDDPVTEVRVIQIVLLIIMMTNGVFLSFRISPYLLKREEQGKSEELLPQELQNKIIVSFLVSVVCWWSEVVIFSWYLIHRF